MGLGWRPNQRISRPANRVSCCCQGSFLRRLGSRGCYCETRRRLMRQPLGPEYELTKGFIYNGSESPPAQGPIGSGTF
jgi:hypothetical protein